MKPIVSSVSKPADENRVAIMDNNPRDMSVDDVLAIYRAAF